MRQLTPDLINWYNAQDAVHMMFDEAEAAAHIPICDEWGEPRVTPEGVRYTVSGDRERAARRLAQVVRR